MANALKLIVYPRVPMNIRGQVVNPGESAEVLDERDMAHLSHAEAARFFRIDADTGAGTEYSISDGVKWEFNASKADAEAAVGGGAEKPHGKSKKH